MSTNRPSRTTLGLASLFRFIAILVGLSLLLGLVWLPFDAFGASVPEWIYWAFVFPPQVVVAIVLTRRSQRHRGPPIAAQVPEAKPESGSDDRSALQGRSAGHNVVSDDSGWKGVLRFAVPGLGSVFSRADLDALMGLRAIYLSFLSALGLIGLVVGILAGDMGGSAPPWLVAAAVVGLAGALLVTGRIIERPLDCSSDEALVGSYRTRFFLRVAFAEAGALLGFVGFILSGNGWVYPAGLAIALIGFARAAPTAARLEGDQRELAGAGCSRNLISLLRTARPEPDE